LLVALSRNFYSNDLLNEKVERLLIQFKFKTV
jgi:hypothetical protein